MSVTDDFTQDELAEMFEYLDGPRSSGVTNMFGASAYLAAEYEMDEAIARKVVTAWMTTFSPTTKPSQRVDQLLQGRVAQW